MRVVSFFAAIVLGATHSELTSGMFNVNATLFFLKKKHLSFDREEGGRLVAQIQVLYFMLMSCTRGDEAMCQAESQFTNAVW